MRHASNACVNLLSYKSSKAKGGFRFICYSWPPQFGVPHSLCSLYTTQSPLQRRARYPDPSYSVSSSSQKIIILASSQTSLLRPAHFLRDLQLRQTLALLHLTATIFSPRRTRESPIAPPTPQDSTSQLKSTTCSTSTTGQIAN